MEYWVAFKNGEYVCGTDEFGYPIQAFCGYIRKDTGNGLLQRVKENNYARGLDRN